MGRYLGTKRKFGRKAQELVKEAQQLGTRCEIWGQGTIFGREAQDLRKGDFYLERARFGREAQNGRKTKICARGADFEQKVQDLSAKREMWVQSETFGSEARSGRD